MHKLHNPHMPHMYDVCMYVCMYEYATCLYFHTTRECQNSSALLVAQLRSASATHPYLYGAVRLRACQAKASKESRPRALQPSAARGPEPLAKPKAPAPNLLNCSEGDVGF